MIIYTQWFFMRSSLYFLKNLFFCRFSRSIVRNLLPSTARAVIWAKWYSRLLLGPFYRRWLATGVQLLREAWTLLGGFCCATPGQDSAELPNEALIVHTSLWPHIMTIWTRHRCNYVFPIDLLEVIMSTRRRKKITNCVGYFPFLCRMYPFAIE